MLMRPLDHKAIIHGFPISELTEYLSWTIEIIGVSYISQYHTKTVKNSIQKTDAKTVVSNYLNEQNGWWKTISLANVPIILISSPIFFMFVRLYLCSTRGDIVKWL